MQGVQSAETSLCAGAQDELVKFWDLRKLTQPQQLLDAAASLHGTDLAPRSVQHVRASPTGCRCVRQLMAMCASMGWVLFKAPHMSIALCLLCLLLSRPIHGPGMLCR